MAGKRLDFINPNSAPLAPRTKMNVVWDIYRKVNTLILAFFCITLACALLYYVGSRYGWGIQPTFTGMSYSPNELGPTKVNFLDCLYFSLVTIATLGYGDFRPESFGRLVANVEVVCGIILMGVFVSRLVSRQQDRLTKRLVRGQLNVEIQNFRDQLAHLLQAFRSASPIDQTRVSETLYRSSGLSLSIARYWRHQAQEENLENVIQLRAAGRLLGGLIGLLQMIDKFVAGKSKASIHAKDRDYIRNITESVLAVATVLSERLDDSGINHSYQEVADMVKKLRSQFVLHEYW